VSPRSRGHWDLGRVVAGLSRERAQQAEGLNPRCWDLPSREAMAHVVDSLRAALFPDHFGPRGLGPQGVDAFVGHTLDTALRALQTQVARELALGADGDEDERADAVIAAFAEDIPSIRRSLECDVHAAFRGDPAATSLHEILFCYPGVTAMTHHRIAHALHVRGLPLVARVIAERAHAITGVDIHPGATIGSSFFIDHGTGVVIGETAVVGAHVRLYQGVTLGAKSFPVDPSGALVKGLARHPIVEDHVVIYAGATILGRVTIGHHASIGGNVWLTHSVPPHSRMMQAQPRSDVFDGGAGI